MLKYPTIPNVWKSETVFLSLCNSHAYTYVDRIREIPDIRRHFMKNAFINKKCKISKKKISSNGLN